MDTITSIDLLSSSDEENNCTTTDKVSNFLLSRKIFFCGSFINVGV